MALKPTKQTLITHQLTQKVNTTTIKSTAVEPKVVPTFDLNNNINKFITGNMTLSQFKTLASQSNINITSKTDTVANGNTTITFKYNNKTYTIMCNKQAAASSTDSNTVKTYTADELKAFKLSDKSIAENFDIVSKENSTIKAYAMKVTSKYKTPQELQAAEYQEYSAKLILGRVATENTSIQTSSGAVQEVASTLKKTVKSNVTLTQSNYSTYRNEIDNITGKNVDQLKTDALNKFVTNFSQGNIAYAQVSTILNTIGVTNKTQELKQNVYTVTFTFNKKSYTVQCAKLAALKGTDDKTVETYSLSQAMKKTGLATNEIGTYFDAVTTIAGKANTFALKSEYNSVSKKVLSNKSTQIVAELVNGGKETTTTKTDGSKTIETQNSKGEKTLVKEFNVLGKPTSQIAYKSNVMVKALKWEYDKRNNVSAEISESYSKGVLRTRSVKFANGVKKTQAFDAKGKLISELTVEKSKTTKVTYSSNGSKTVVTTEGDTETTEKYNAQNQLISMTKKERVDDELVLVQKNDYTYKNGTKYSSTERTYERNGSSVAVYECPSKNQKIQTKYNSANQKVLETVYQDSVKTTETKYTYNEKTVVEEVVAYASDGSKTRTTTITEDGKITQTKVDKFDTKSRIISSVTTVDNVVTEDAKYEYDEKGNRYYNITKINNDGTKTVSILTADNQTARKYNSNDQLLQENLYNKINNKMVLAEISVNTYYESGKTKASQHTTYADDGKTVNTRETKNYYENGKLRSEAIEDTANYITHSYNTNGQLLNEYIYKKNGNTKVLSEATINNYDANNNISLTEKRIYSADGKTIKERTRTTYDSNGKISGQVTYDSNGKKVSETTYTYHSNGNIKEATKIYSNGTKEVEEYDNCSQLKSKTTYKKSGNKYIKTEYIEYACSNGHINAETKTTYKNDGVTVAQKIKTNYVVNNKVQEGSYSISYYDLTTDKVTREVRYVDNKQTSEIYYTYNSDGTMDITEITPDGKTVVKKYSNQWSTEDPLLETTYKKVNGKDVPTDKTEYEYDKSGKKVKETYYNYVNGQFVITGKTEYAGYYTDGSCSHSIKYNYVNGQFIKAEETTGRRASTSGQSSTHIVYESDGKTIKTKTKTTNIFGNGLRLIREQTYDSKDRLIAEVEYESDKNYSVIGQIISNTEFQYDSSGKLSKTIKHCSDNTIIETVYNYNNKGIVTTKVSTTYDIKADGTRSTISIGTEYYDSKGEWSHTFIYDPKLKTYKRYDFSNGGLESIQYNKAGNVAEVLLNGSKVKTEKLYAGLVDYSALKAQGYDLPKLAEETNAIGFETYDFIAKTTLQGVMNMVSGGNHYATQFLKAAQVSHETPELCGAKMTDISKETGVVKDKMTTKIQNSIQKEYGYTPEDINGYHWTTDKQICKDMAASSDLINYLKDNKNNIKSGNMKESFQFKSGDLYYAISSVSVMDTKLSGKYLTLTLGDIYDYNTQNIANVNNTNNAGTILDGVGAAAMRDGLLKPFYEVFEVKVDLTTIFSQAELKQMGLIK